MTHASFRRISAAILAVGAVVACFGGDVSAPAARNAGTAYGRAPISGDRTESDPQSANAQQRVSPVACSPHAPVVGSGVFGPAGGTLVFGNSRLVIPGGALRDTVTITATSLGDSTSSVDFQPEGLHFAKPAGLVLDGSGCVLGNGGDSLSVVYLAPEGTVLETIPAVYDPHWKAVAAPIVHFSRYAIAGPYAIAF